MIELTKKELLELNSTLRSVANLKGLKFALFYQRNKRVLDAKEKEINEETEALQKTFSHLDKEIQERATGHQAIINKFAKKDKDGKPVQVKADADIEDLDSCNKEITAFMKKYEPLDKKVEGARETINKSLETKVKIELSYIKEEFLPQDITGKQVDGISVLIK